MQAPVPPPVAVNVGDNGNGKPVLRLRLHTGSMIDVAINFVDFAKLATIVPVHNSREAK